MQTFAQPVPRTEAEIEATRRALAESKPSAAAAPLDRIERIQQRVDDRLLEKKLMAETLAAQDAELRKPVTAVDRSKNVLRPRSFDGIVGQDAAKAMMRRVVASCLDLGEPLDHTLLVASSGAGKSTFSHVIAEEMGVDVYEVEAPVSRDTLLQLREVMQYGDILRIEEIHQQAVSDRRGRESSTLPEVLYAVMEDRIITTDEGVLPFPEITVIGTTTDEGLLPDAFVARFPLRPHLDPYSTVELESIAKANAAALGIEITDAAATVFAKASRGVPRTINNYVKNARKLTATGRVTVPDANEVLRFNRVTHDGLTSDMQATLVFMLTRSKRVTGKGEVIYQASINTIATAIGKSRDSKAVALRVEPYLIQQGLLQVTHGGRKLTDAGIARAKQLRKGTP